MTSPTDTPAPAAPARPVNSVLGGQKALVTGASSGIGRAIALALGSAGADVVVNYITGEERAEAVVEAIRADGGKAYAAAADVSREDEVRAMFGRMIERFGTIDILINNAGLQRDAAFRDMTLVPHGRIGEPEDIGRAAVWLASDDADYVIGSTLFVDGGMTLYPCFAENG
jgi:glucose 1-dehydrogenase